MKTLIGRAHTPLELISARIPVYPRCGVPDLSGFTEIKGAKAVNVYAYEILDSERERPSESSDEWRRGRQHALNAVAVFTGITHEKAAERFEIYVVPFPDENDPNGRIFFKEKLRR